MDTEAREALILKLFRAFPGAENKISRAVVNEYLEAVEKFSVTALGAAVAQFREGLVERDSHAFVPKAPELAIVARRCQSVEDMRSAPAGPNVIPYRLGEAPPEGFVALGPDKVDFGHGAIDMREMSAGEKEEVLKLKGRPKQGGNSVVPHIRRM